jgi:F-type H+-transporting ATPase subunit b
MPQLDPTFYASQLFWLLISFAILFLLMWKVALPRVSDILTTRQNRIDQDLERAAGLKEEADEVMTAYEAELAGSRSKALEALKAVQNKAAEDAAKQSAALETSLAAELNEAEKRIGESRTAALANIDTIATELAAAAFEKLIGESAETDVISAAVKGAGGNRA